MTSGALIPPKTDEQLAALARLETMLALVEGWVDVGDRRRHRRGCRRATRSPSRSAGAAPRADRPSPRSRRSSASSCGRADCARPRRCGRRSRMRWAPRRATRCGRTPTSADRSPTSTTRAALDRATHRRRHREPRRRSTRRSRSCSATRRPAAPGEDGEEPQPTQTRRRLWTDRRAPTRRSRHAARHGPHASTRHSRSCGAPPPTCSSASTTARVVLARPATSRPADRRAPPRRVVETAAHDRRGPRRRPRAGGARARGAASRVRPARCRRTVAGHPNAVVAVDADGPIGERARRDLACSATTRSSSARRPVERRRPAPPTSRAAVIAATGSSGPATHALAAPRRPAPADRVRRRGRTVGPLVEPGRRAVPALPRPRPPRRRPGLAGDRGAARRAAGGDAAPTARRWSRSPRCAVARDRRPARARPGRSWRGCLDGARRDGRATRRGDAGTRRIPSAGAELLRGSDWLPFASMRAALSRGQVSGEPAPCPRDADVEQSALLVDRVESLRVGDRQQCPR